MIRIGMALIIFFLSIYFYCSAAGVAESFPDMFFHWGIASMILGPMLGTSIAVFDRKLFSDFGKVLVDGKSLSAADLKGISLYLSVMAEIATYATIVCFFMQSMNAYGYLDQIDKAPVFLGKATSPVIFCVCILILLNLLDSYIETNAIKSKDDNDEVVVDAIAPLFTGRLSPWLGFIVTFILLLVGFVQTGSLHLLPEITINPPATSILLGV